MVCSAEDVGNADPQAFLLCEAASRAVEQIGWPEARIPLAQAVIYVANAPKSNATVLAVDAALAADDAPIPEGIRDAHTSTARMAGRGVGYHYSHDDYDRAQTFLPDKLRGTAFYEPRRPQERSWRDHQEPDAVALAALWQIWVETHSDGGELPLEAWSAELTCSREALARALGKLAAGRFTLGRKLEAKPI
jgi:putative ATPase